MSSAPSVLLIGASGYIGVPLTSEFILHKSKFGRLAILTEEFKKEKFTQAVDQGFELVFGSFFDASSFAGFDTVISLLGDHAMKYQPGIIKACLSAGVTDFYPSEYGSDIEQGDYPANRYFRDKIITREAARKAVVDSAVSGKEFNYTLVMVGGFMEFLTKPLFGADLVEKTFTFYGKKEKTEAVTAMKDVARYIVASTLLPKSPTHSRAFKVPGGVFSWEEIVATISKTSGVEYKAIWLPTEEADRLAREALAKGDVNAELGYSLKALMGREGQFGVPRPWDNEKFDIVPQGLEVTLKAFFDELK